MKKKDNGLVFAILFAAIAVSGSLVFFGLKFTGGAKASVSQADIEKGIDAYIEVQKSKSQPEQPAPQKVSGDYSDDDAYMGDEDAPIVMIEFSDFQCPYCRSFYNDTLPAIKEKYIDTGKVKFVYRDFPLSFHAGAIPAATASECAREQGGDEMYFAMHDKIFDGQNELGAGTVSIENESLVAYAKELGLDMKEFNNCFEADAFKEEIEADIADGQSVGISGTPGFIINGEIVSGAQPFSVFESIFEGELKK